MWREEENIFCQEVDVVKNENFEDAGYSGQLQAEARCIVQHPGFEETGEGWLRLSSARNLRNITCFLFPLHEFVADSVPFFYQSTAF